MIFLIEYDRPQGRIVTFKTFDDQNYVDAADERFAIEIALHRQGVVDREVVLLQAASEQAVRQTHRRYFETIRELIAPPAA